jgi:hypothetical protein
VGAIAQGARQTQGKSCAAGGERQVDAGASCRDQVQVARNVDDAIVRFLRERGYFTLTAERFRERPSAPLDRKSVV